MNKIAGFPRLALVAACVAAGGLAALVSCGEDAAPPSAPPPPPPIDFDFPVEDEVVHDPEPRELPGGLVVQCREPGTGRVAGPGDLLVVHWRGSLAEGGEEVDSTYESGIPRRVTLGKTPLIPGLERGLAGTRSGSRWRLEIPAPLAYGEEGLGAIPPDANLVYLVDVIRIE